MEAFTFILDSLQKVIYAAGIFLIVMNGITLAQNLKETQGTQITSAILGILGGVLICICGGGLDLVRSGLEPPKETAILQDTLEFSLTYIKYVLM